MFGGAGFCKEGIMFGGIMGGSLHFKVNDINRLDFIKKGMEPFYHGKNKNPIPSYFQTPKEIPEDKYALKIWAQKASNTAAKGKSCLHEGGKR